MCYICYIYIYVCISDKYQCSTVVQCERITVDRSFCLKVFWEVLRLVTGVWLRLDFSFSN